MSGETFFVNDHLKVVGFVSKITCWSDEVDQNYLEFKPVKSETEHLILLDYSDPEDLSNPLTKVSQSGGKKSRVKQRSGTTEQDDESYPT